MVVVIWLMAPVLVIIPLGFSDAQSFKFPPEGWSLRWYSKFFSDPAWSEALVTSLVIAVLVMFVTTFVGTAAAYALDRAREAAKGKDVRIGGSEGRVKATGQGARVDELVQPMRRRGEQWQ